MIPFWLPGMLIVLGLVGAAGWAYRRRPRPQYPAPETFITQPELAESRIVPLQGGVNFRDIGGYATTDGHYVRWGQVYRTGALASLSVAGWEVVRGLGVKVICDLRSIEESADAPDAIPDGLAAYRHLPLKAEIDSGQRLRTILFAPGKVPQMMRDSYVHLMIDQNAEVFGAVLRQFAEDDALPAIVHCTAGKDRTGVTVALLLALLGVPDEIIAADYALSNRDFTHFYDYARKTLSPVAWMGVTADDVYPLLVADPAVILATLAHVRSQYGSVEVYLRERAGLDEAAQARLRARLLTDTPDKPSSR
jgi:protein-tyrosine phosphatase